MANGDLSEDSGMEVLSEDHRPFCGTRRAAPPAFAGEGDKERVVARGTPRFGAAKVEDAAGEVLLEGAGYLGSQEPVALLESRLPLGLQLLVVVVDELVEEAVFRLPAAILDEAS